MKCIVCGESVESDQDNYCRSHATALQKIRKAYEDWQKAYLELRPEDYLSKLSKLSQTGDRVREVADFFAKNPERWTA